MRIPHPYRFHLVLGGTRGIGAAYARSLARQGAQLHILGRETESRAAIERECRDFGSPEVRTEALDLSIPTMFEDWLNRQGNTRFASVFLGGPSPAPGPSARVGRAEHAHAAWVCSALPAMLLQWLRERASADDPVELSWLGSSVAGELETDHEFFLSGLYRRTTGAWLRAVAATADWLRLAVHEPKVVESGMSLAYAAIRQGHSIEPDPERTLPAAERAALRKFLAQHFAVNPVPTADDFIAEWMAKGTRRWFGLKQQ